MFASSVPRAQKAIGFRILVPLYRRQSVYLVLVAKKANTSKSLARATEILFVILVLHLAFSRRLRYGYFLRFLTVQGQACAAGLNRICYSRGDPICAGGCGEGECIADNVCRCPLVRGIYGEITKSSSYSFFRPPMRSFVSQDLPWIFCYV